MIKNNSIELGAYVSPDVKVAQLKARRVMCQSPYGNSGEAGGGFDKENTNDYEDELL